MIGMQKVPRFSRQCKGTDGSWRATYEPIVDTSFAILFLGRSTEKTITRIQITRLGRGTMIGGTGTTRSFGHAHRDLSPKNGTI